MAERSLNERRIHEFSEFIADGPLYKWVTLDVAQAVSTQSGPATETIRRYCKQCEGDTSWDANDKRAVGHFETFECTICEKEAVTVWFVQQPIDAKNGLCSGWRVKKVGESELPVPRPSRVVLKLLGEDAGKYYQKALACLGEGFGIGAIAYFRRVIEDRTNLLLDRIAGAAADDGDEQTMLAIAHAKSSERTSDRLKEAAKVLPQWLRPGGANPLGVLYGSYSDDLHSSESDDSACERAAALREAFEFVIEAVERHLHDVERFRKRLAQTAGGA